MNVICFYKVALKYRNVRIKKNIHRFHFDVNVFISEQKKILYEMTLLHSPRTQIKRSFSTTLHVVT